MFKIIWASSVMELICLILLELITKRLNSVRQIRLGMPYWAMKQMKVILHSAMNTAKYFNERWLLEDELKCPCVSWTAIYYLNDLIPQTKRYWWSSTSWSLTLIYKFISSTSQSIARKPSGLPDGLHSQLRRIAFLINYYLSQYQVFYVNRTWTYTRLGG